MRVIRVRVTAEADGELHLRGLPLQRGQEAEVIVPTDADETNTDHVLLAVLRHDPAWAWLQDPAEDLYAEADVQ
jgi:hypothetical protein